MTSSCINSTEVRVWMSNYTPHGTMPVITNSCHNYNKYLSAKGAPTVLPYQAFPLGWVHSRAWTCGPNYGRHPGCSVNVPGWSSWRLCHSPWSSQGPTSPGCWWRVCDPERAMLTHWGRVMHVCVIELTHHCFIIAWPAPSHYLNQCWNVVNWTLRN